MSHSTDTPLMSIAKHIDDLTRRPDGSQPLTTAETLLLANFILNFGKTAISEFSHHHLAAMLHQ